ncbi:AI-2E family transporter [Saccharopolyspora rhizosphaerae]|uniref:AI-2E family transporter n=1 Tax=Saccharopolyspora rhizosphaerae TaxID=2492662 RepID=A0A3R8R565_9PSEU|nr:AI-2E family transporter [Saccharopolyspora rhizosphaerae]RRO18627.1 AI-2E family transporter [Saccharopolyspora rhizosphaerae]
MSNPPGGRERGSLPLTRHAQIAVVYLAVGTFAVLAYTVRDMLVLVFLGFFFALGVEPAINWLQRYQVRRGLALVGVLAVVLLLVGALVPLVLVPAIGQLRDFISRVPDLLAGLGANLGNPDELRTHLQDPGLQEKVEEAVSRAASFAGQALTAGFAALGTVFGGVFAVCTTGALLVYFSLAMPRIHAAVDRVEATGAGRADALRAAMSRVGGYVTGQAVVSLCAGVVSYVFFLIAGVPHPALLAVVVALLDTVPQIGATLASLAGTVVALSQSVTLAVVTLVFFIVYQAFENYLLTPRVFAKAVELSPLGAFVAILLGGALAGVLGAMLALPVTAALKVLYRHARTEIAAGESG